MIRYIFRCKSCPHIWARDYEEPEQPTWKPRRHVMIAGLPKSYTPEMDRADCPRCHRNATMRRVVGVYSAAVRCDARCTDATGVACTCSCAGANHGKKLLHDRP